MDFYYTENPGYYDLFLGSYNAIKWHYRLDNWKNYTFPDEIIQDFKLFRIPYQETVPAVYLLVGFTIARYLFNLIICKVIVEF